MFVTEKPYTILIIDDSKEDREDYRRMLSPEYRVLEARDAAEGLALWRQHQPACWILDYGLPDRDGLELLNLLTSEAGFNACAVVRLTGYSDPGIAISALKRGAQDFLDRNRVTPEQLQRAVLNAIEKVELHRALARQKEWLEITFNSIGDAVITTDAEGVITSANPAAETLLGRTGGELVGLAFAAVGTLVPNNSSPIVNEPLMPILKYGRVAYFTDYTLVGQDGRTVPVDGQGNPMRNGGNPAYGAVLVFRDISERKRADEELNRHRDHLQELVAQRTQDLEETNRILEARSAEVADLYHHAPCGYHSFNSEGVLVAINDTELEWLGYRREDVVGRLRYDQLIAADYLPLFHADFSRIQEAGTVVDQEVELLRQDGSRLPVRVRATGTFDPEGRFIQSRSTLFDDRERKAGKRKLPG